MPQICGCIGNKSNESMKFQPISRLCWPWKKQNQIIDKCPISSRTQIGESFDINDADINAILKNPPIARCESEDQDSMTRSTIGEQTTSFTKTNHTPVTFELSPPQECPLHDVSQRNQSLHIEIGHTFERSKEMDSPSRTYPNMLNIKSSMASARLYPNHTGAPIRRGSLIIRTNRPLPSGATSNAFNERRSAGLSFALNSPPSQSSIVRHDSHIGIERFLDDAIIVTPYAQILAGLRSVQKNIAWLTNSGKDKTLPKNQQIDTTSPTTDEDFNVVALGTQKELEWCLQLLENIQTKRPVSDMASTKFKRLLSQKLGSFKTTDKARNQISEYISKTFMDEFSELDDDEEDAFKPDTGENHRSANFNNISLSPPSHKHRFSLGSSSTTNNQCFTVDSKRSSLSCSTPQNVSNIVSSFNNADGLPELEARNHIPYHGFDTQNADELKEVLESSLDAWGLNIFDIDLLSCEHALTIIGYRIFSKRELFDTFNIDPGTFVNYILQLEASYLSTNPYHNHVHAADVLQSVHVLMQAETLEGVFSDLEILSSLFASAIHDVHHPGLTNQFLINTGHKLALLYNDASVLENHHLSVAFKLLTEPGCDIFANIASKQRQTLRRLVIELVLATDMSKHMNLLAELRTMVETKELTGSGYLNLDDHNDRSLVLQCMIHCADLSNPAKPFPLYKQWTYRVMEEFFRQGDKEKELGIEVSAMCDRESVVVDKTQIGFIDFVVHPLYETWCDLVHPAAERILETLDANRDIIHNESPFKQFELKTKDMETQNDKSSEVPHDPPTTQHPGKSQ